MIGTASRRNEGQRVYRAALLAAVIAVHLLVTRTLDTLLTAPRLG